MAHYDIFRDQLAIRFPGYGRALWEPSSWGLYATSVGDVGYITALYKIVVTPDKF